jgi:fermentation-respiration switch protein FrsA (DUF1100 family)
LTLIILLVIAALVMSLFLTRRYHLIETRSPAELGLPFENVAFQSSDGLTLRGWWIPAPGSDRAIIQLHGHSGSMDPDVQYLPAWHAAGLNVLPFDFRAHGRSQGRATTFGYLERRDVQGALRFLKQEKGMRRVALVGFSLGGMVAILSAPVCPEVDAVVEDGAPARLRSALAVWSVEHGLPRWLARPLAWLAVMGASLRLGANLFRCEPLRWIGKITCPLMIIHGDLDQYCPDFEALLAAAHPAEVWRLPDVGHVQASQVYPEEYRRRVADFLSRHL